MLAQPSHALPTSPPIPLPHFCSVQLKMLLIGDGSVGKTSLLARYSEDKFNEHWISTIGIDFKTKVLELDGMRVRCQIWDTAGQERFRAITTSFFRGAQGIALCFDVSNPSSYESIATWMTHVKDNSDKGVRLIIIATKMDRPDAVITRQQAEELASRHSTPDRPIPVYFTSSKNNEGVTEAFEGLATLALQHSLALQSSKQKSRAAAAAAAAAAADSGSVTLDSKGGAAAKGCGSC
jgi:small GTP-binding protein